MVRRDERDTGTVTSDEDRATNDGLVVRDEPTASRYEARFGDTVAAFSEYRSLPGRLVFVHTVTAPEFAGRGIADRLARGLLDDVRARGLKLTPICEYIAGFIARHPEDADLVSWGRERRRA